MRVLPCVLDAGLSLDAKKMVAIRSSVPNPALKRSASSVPGIGNSAKEPAKAVPLRFWKERRRKRVQILLFSKKTSLRAGLLQSRTRILKMKRLRRRKRAHSPDSLFERFTKKTKVEVIEDDEDEDDPGVDVDLSDDEDRDAHDDEDEDDAGFDVEEDEYGFDDGEEEDDDGEDEEDNDLQEDFE
jgi:hypothetical protein